jgi:hypothetical protein
MLKSSSADLESSRSALLCLIFSASHKRAASSLPKQMSPTPGRYKVTLRHVWSDRICTDGARRGAVPGRVWGNAYSCLCTSIVRIVSGLFTRAERIFLSAMRKITQVSLVWRLTI